MINLSPKPPNNDGGIDGDDDQKMEHSRQSGGGNEIGNLKTGDLVNEREGTKMRKSRHGRKERIKMVSLVEVGESAFQ